jgi:ribulose-phosphate 3-epimerase
MCIDWLNAGKQLEALNEFEIDYLHWDVIDGGFAPDFSMGSSIINTFRKQTTIRSDYHLMVEEPSRLFDAFEISPKDIFSIHQECCRNLHRDLIALRQKGARVGVAICPGTSLNVLDYIIESVDVVLLMTVNPGFKGQKLVAQTLRKLEDLRRMVDDLGLHTEISVDGNITYGYIPDMIANGADILVVGSSGLFREDMPISDSMGYLRDSIDRGLARI